MQLQKFVMKVLNRFHTYRTIDSKRCCIICNIFRIKKWLLNCARLSMYQIVIDRDYGDDYTPHRPLFLSVV